MLQQHCHVARLELNELRHGIDTIQRQIRVKPVCESFELQVSAGHVARATPELNGDIPRVAP